jgi:RHS repeat-associated protein
MGQKQCSDYQVFGMQMPGRNGSTGDYRYGFNGMESDDEVKGEGNSLDFGARIYDSRVGRWLSTDPAFKNYTDLSPYGYTANNPVLFIEIDGMVFDLSNLTKKEKKAYLKKVNDLKNRSKMFNYYYTYLDKSERTFTVKENDVTKAPGGYRLTDRTILLKDIENVNENVITQEIFHAYQFELIYEGKAYQNAQGVPYANIETEGDILTLYVAFESGGVGTVYGWEGEELLEFSYDGDMTTDILTSKEYLGAYDKAIDSRIEFYKKKSENSERSYSTYTKPKQDFGPEAIIKIVKEIEATASGLQGPRLENGDYYED